MIGARDGVGQAARGSQGRLDLRTPAQRGEVSYPTL